MRKKKRAVRKKEPRSNRLPGFAAGAAFGLALVLAFASGGDAIKPPAAADARNTRELAPSPQGESRDATQAPAAAPDPDTGPSPSEVNPSASAETSEIRILAVGDLVFSRRIAERLLLDGWGGAFRFMPALSASADIVFGNLETSASLLGEPYPGKAPVITFRATPGAVLGLKKAGFSVVSIANNHINDYGPRAIAETVDALDAVGIAHCGAGTSEAEASRPAVLNVRGKRFAFLGYTEDMWSIREAGAEAGAMILREPRVIADIKKARKVADFVLVSLHWGEEMQGIPRASDQAAARRFIDAGADAILGHHPHVLQGAEFYKGKPILYSMGNFVFDMQSARTYESAAAVLRFGSEGPRELRFRPVRIDAETFAPAPAEGDDARGIGSMLAERCAAVGGRLETLEDGWYRLRPPGAYRTAFKRTDKSSSE